MRIQNDTTARDAMVALARGSTGINPGALSVISELAAQDAALLLFLDEHGIYGENIWLAFRDVCGEDLQRLINALLYEPIQLVADIRAKGGKI